MRGHYAPVYPIENCIQKSDYHIYYSDVNFGRYDLGKIGELDEDYITLDLKKQVIKLLALIFNPGIVTPAIQERCMQIAYTSKLSSGCISRQVGAIVTDNNFSVKAIGWNDVAENQIPCNLRDFRDLRDQRNSDHFSEFEKDIGQSQELKYKDGLSFKDKIEDRYSMVSDLDKQLNGKVCSFCFKSCHWIYWSILTPQN